MRSIFIRYFSALVLVIAIGSQATFANDRDDCANARDFEVIITACSRIIAQDSNAGWAYANRSFAYERINKYERALADGDTAVRLDPRNPTAYLNRAAALIGLELYDRAIADVNRALELNPRDAQALVNRAYAHEKLGQRDRAIADYRRTLEVEPSHAYAKRALRDLGVEP